MTAQKQPLEVGVPLYPFSHEGVFGGNNKAPQGSPDDPVAPLPHSAESQSISSPGTNGLTTPCMATSMLSHRGSVSSSGWPSPPVSEEILVSHSSRRPSFAL
jgi:hypothetical protein